MSVRGSSVRCINDLNEVPPSDDWFPYKFIDAEVNKKLGKTKGRLTGDEMEKETKNYVEYLNHDPNWLKMITIEIYKLIIDPEYINFFIIMYMKWIKDNGHNSSFWTLKIPRLPRFEKLALSQFQLYIEAQAKTQCFVFRNFKKTIYYYICWMQKKVFVFYTC